MGERFVSGIPGRDFEDTACETTEVAAVDDRIAAVNEYVEHDRRFQVEMREIKQRQERAEKARIQRDRARQRLLTLLGVEQAPSPDELAERFGGFQRTHG